MNKEYAVLYSLATGTYFFFDIEYYLEADIQFSTGLIFVVASSECIAEVPKAPRFQITLGTKQFALHELLFPVKLL